jgi:hypothetical protein
MTNFADHLRAALTKQPVVEVLGIKQPVVEVLGIPADTVILLNPRWKIEDGKEVLDLEETAKASVVITNIGGAK